MSDTLNFTSLSAELQAKAQKLRQILQSLPAPFYIACSGGLDSRFLAFFAQKCGCGFSLIHAAGPHIDPKETQYLDTWSRQRNMPLRTVAVNALSVPQAAYNSKERCYHCKRLTFKTMQSLIGSAVLCDGSHADDGFAYRPGLRALQELGIQSPLALANFSKQDIRETGKAIGLENYGQKARPCLLTRFPYNTEINETALTAIAELEDFFEKELQKLFGTDIPDFRIRNIEGTFQFHYCVPLQKEHLNALQNAAVSAKILSIQYKRLDKLSGYFDYTEPRKP